MKWSLKAKRNINMDVHEQKHLAYNKTGS